MLILSRVCVEFHNSRGETVHRVTPGMLQTFHEAPDSIRDDPIFRLRWQGRTDSGKKIESSAFDFEKINLVNSSLDSDIMKLITGHRVE